MILGCELSLRMALSISKTQHRSHRNDLCSWDVICWLSWTLNSKGSFGQVAPPQGDQVEVTIKQSVMHTPKSQCHLPPSAAPSQPPGVAAPLSLPLCQKGLLLQPVLQTSCWCSVQLSGWELDVSWGRVLGREPRESPVSCGEAAL